MLGDKIKQLKCLCTLPILSHLIQKFFASYNPIKFSSKGRPMKTENSHRIYNGKQWLEECIESAHVRAGKAWPAGGCLIGVNGTHWEIGEILKWEIMRD